ncbi:MAG: GDP-L-fucose synthase [Patescibacteria group bacterium]
MNKQAKIFVAGHGGLVGSAIVRALISLGYKNLILKTRKELDLLNQAEVNRFFANQKPDYVFLAAAKVGGISANAQYPADFIYENLVIETNIIFAAYKNKVKKLIFLGSSCIYPRNCPQPIKEEYLLTSPLEKTNEAYAIAKIAGLKMCQYYNQQYGTKFIAVMPTNLYGPNDNFDLTSSHVLPAMIRKFHEAKIGGKKAVVLWGSGQPRREFLHVDDLATALIFLINNYQGQEIINIGSGRDLTIKELANKIKRVVGYTGKITWDKSKPDGTPRKLLNVNRLNKLGWQAKMDLDRGLMETYNWFQKNSKIKYTK